MANVVICDRCGSFGKSGALGAIIVQPDLTNRTPEGKDVSELCPSCIGELMTWLKSAPARELTARPFTEPYSAPQDATQ